MTLATAAAADLLTGALVVVWAIVAAYTGRGALRAHRRGIARVRAAQAREDARDEAFVTALRDVATASWLDPRVPPQRGNSWEQS